MVKWRKPIFFSLGIVFLGLAYVGVALPGIPGIPFILLSGWFFLESNEKLYNWMLRQRFIGPVLKKFYSGEGVTNKARWFVISQFWVSIIIAQIVFPLSTTWIIAVNSIGVIGSIVIYKLIKV